MNERLTITEVAKYVGVTPRTIMRWEKAGKVRKSRRDWRGWRFYIKDDVEDIRKFYESSYEYDQVGRTIMDISKMTAISLLIAASLASFPIICGTAEAQSEVAKPSQSPAIVETNTVVSVDLAKLPTIGTPPSGFSEASKYKLGANDVIEIDVRRHPEFSGKYAVTAEGKIEYKFVGDVFVDGLTKFELQARLQAILSDYIIEPEVNVQILEYLSKVFYVIGEVNRPGKYYMRGNSIAILEAITQAGLPNQASATRKCRLISPNAKGTNNIIYVNVYELLYAGNLKYNLSMKPGDVLYIPSTVMAKVIQIIRPVTDTVSSAVGSAAAGAAIAL